MTARWIPFRFSLFASMRCCTIALTVFAAFILPLRFAGAQQVETTAECDEGVIAEPVVLQYGDSTTGCGISPSTETDRFVFSGSVDQLVRFRLLTLSNGLDPAVEVRDATNTLIGTFSCDANSVSRCSTGLDLVLPNSGDFLIIVSETGADNVGNYTLSIELISPAAPAVDIGYDEVSGDSISPTTDTDFFQFEASAGTSLRLNGITFSNDFDPRVQVRDPNGAIVLDGLTDGVGCNANSVSRCSFAMDWIPPVDGTYSLIVYDDDGFNGGSYQLSLWCLYGDCAGSPTPDESGPVLHFVTATSDAIESNADGDFFTFNATSGTTLEFRSLSLSNDLDLRVQLRDPTGAIIVDGLSDGGGCDANSVSRCGFRFSLSPGLAGTYSALIFDNDSFNTGSYEISILCVLGACDGDGDTHPDGDREVLSYGAAITGNGISPSTEGDFYEFMGTDGDEIRLTVNSASNNFDPRIQVHNPNGALVVNGIADGGGCDSNSVSTCSFSVTLFPDATGTHSLAIFDDDGFNAGNYTISLECIFGTGPGFTCVDLILPPFICADNCSVIANPDQRDSNLDGYGNVCDPDLDDDGQVNSADLGVFRGVFFTNDADADFNGDGFVNFIDLAVMQEYFFLTPGPSCSYPNSP